MGHIDIAQVNSCGGLDGGGASSTQYVLRIAIKATRDGLRFLQKSKEFSGVWSIFYFYEYYLI